jgi:hypothetical protein
VEIQIDMASTSEKVDIEKTDGAVSGIGWRAAVTSEELARKTGLHERWIREGLYGQAAASIIDYIGEGRFELSPESALVFGEREQPLLSRRRILCAAAADGSAQYATRIIQERYGTDLRSTRPGSESRSRVTAGSVVPHTTRSERAAEARWSRRQAAGRGQSRRRWMRRRSRTDRDGEAYPRSSFHGYDIATIPLARASENAKQAGIKSTMLASIRSPVMRVTISSRPSNACAI